MVVAGIDIGSTTTKVVFLSRDRRILAASVGPTGFMPDEAASREIEECCRQSNTTTADVLYWVSTGYGRELVTFANEEITEISCHARGAHVIFPESRAVIDIGGQDSKAITIDEAGRVVNFAMNDKCAAGTGKFLDVTARAMGVSPAEMGRLSLQSKVEVTVSSICTVFAESEVISLISKRVNPVDILAGINRAVVRRLQGLISRAKGCPPFAMTGGVAKNPGVVKALEELLQSKLLIPEDSQIVGALGAAHIALDKFEKTTRRILSPGIANRS